MPQTITINIILNENTTEKVIVINLLQEKPKKKPSNEFYYGGC